MLWFNFAHHEVTKLNFLIENNDSSIYVGMKRNFLELKGFLENQYPQLIGYIDGANYPPPAYAQYVASATTALYFGGIALLMGGDSIFQMLGMAPPPFYDVIKTNKMMTFGNIKQIS
jgi:hypothetical protein